MTDSQDQIHINKVLGGNAHAFSYLLEKYKDYVFTIAVNIVKNREEAEDVAQESFVKAYSQLKTFKGNSKFSTWLYTITFRTAISATRKNNLAMSDIDTYIIDNYGDDGLVNQIEMLAKKDREFYIKKALAALPELDALVLTLYYLNENTTEEIEEITGLNKNNIKVRMHRARKKLAESIERILPNEMASFN
ncbi:MAG: RNA polymerase sigma factor [Flavobacteriaceae bacterium]